MATTLPYLRMFHLPLSLMENLAIGRGRNILMPMTSYGSAAYTITPTL